MILGLYPIFAEDYNLTATATKRCKIHYRRLRKDGLSLPQGTLSKLITNALETRVNGALIKDRVNLRIAPPFSGDGPQSLINDLYLADQYVFGNICRFTPGQMQALLRTTPDHTSHQSLSNTLNAYDIRETHAEDGYEYVDGICYWLAIDDHFYQIQHVSLQIKQVEEYLNWLLRDKTNTVGGSDAIELMCEFDQSQVGGDLGDISAIEIGGIAPETIYQPPDKKTDMHDVKEVEKTKEIGSKYAKFEKAKGILDALFGPAGTQKIMDQIPDEASLEVKVNIGYKATRRKFGKEFMSNIASGLRNLPDGEMKVRGKQGKIHGSDIRLSEDMSVRKMEGDSSLLDMEHARDQMLEVHRRFIHDGKI